MQLWKEEIVTLVESGYEVRRTRVKGEVAESSGERFLLHSYPSSANGRGKG